MRIQITKCNFHLIILLFAWVTFFKYTQQKLQPCYLTSGWRVWGDEKYDYVSIKLLDKSYPLKVIIRTPHKTRQRSPQTKANRNGLRNLRDPA